MTIICLFGEDGTGKTTLADLVAQHLQDEGYKVSRAWMRGSHTLASLLSKFLHEFQVFRWIENPYYEVHIPSTLTKLWQLIEYISLLPIILTRYLVPSKFGNIVVADRCVQDFIVWVSLITHNHSFHQSWYSKQLLSLLPTDTASFYVTASKQEIHRRTKEKIMTLNTQKKLYRSLAEGCFVIDTTGKTAKQSLLEVLTALQGFGFL